MEQKKRLKNNFSLFRVSIGIIIGLIFLIILLLVDDNFANAPYYKDIQPRWTLDGKSIIYFRWYPYKFGYQNPFEIWKINPKNKKKILLYHSKNGYTIYGVRRLRLSNNKKYINLRLNKKNIFNGEIEDLLVKISLSGKQKPISWKLDKKHPYDIFLAFKDDRVLLRQYPTKKNKNITVSEYKFSSKEKIKEYKIPPSYICSLADFFGENNRIFGIIIKPLRFRKKILNKVFDFKQNKSYKISNKFYRFYYITLKNSLLIIDTLDNNYSFLTINLKNNREKNIPNPLKDNDKNGDALLTPDEKHIMISNGFKLKEINIDSFNQKNIPVPYGKIESFDINPINKNIVYANNESINIINIKGKNYKKLTNPSLKSLYLKNKTYRKYLSIREKIIFGESCNR